VYYLLFIVVLFSIVLPRKNEKTEKCCSFLRVLKNHNGLDWVFMEVDGK